MASGAKGRKTVASASWRAASVSFALAVALIATGCRTVPAGSPANPQGNSQSDLQVDIETSPTSLDPRTASDAISQRLDELVYDSLVRPGRDLAMIGDLACSFERKSPTVMVFHLCPGARFSDGRPLTARDVKYTYDSVLSPVTLSPKRGALAELQSVTTPDDSTVVMTTRDPYAPALEMATFGVIPYGASAPGAGSSIAPPGSGPFAIESFRGDEYIVLARNPFHVRPPGSPTRIVFKVVPDPTVRALELAEGICGFAENNIKPDLLGYLSDRHTLAINRSPGTTYQYLMFSFHDSRLRDVRVRRALAYAIDRGAIAEYMLRGTARLASGLLAPESWAYSADVQTYGYDPAQAGALLDQAGYPRHADGLRGLRFVYKTTPEGAPLAEAIQAMLLRVGVSLSVRVNEWGTYFGDIQRGDFDLASLQWVGINDPNHYYLVFDSKMTPPLGFNRGDYVNPAMDRLVEAGRVTLDQSARRKIYAQVQRLAATDLPYVSLFWTDNITVMSRDYSGFVAYPNGSLRSLSTLVIDNSAHPAAAQQASR